MKDMTNRAEVMMTDEERKEMESAGLEVPGSSATTASASPTSPSVAHTPDPMRTSSPPPATAHHTPSLGTEMVHSPASEKPPPTSPASGSGALTPSTSTAGMSPAEIKAEKEKEKARKAKLKAEQNAKLRELDEERRKEMEARYALFSSKICLSVRN